MIRSAAPVKVTVVHPGGVRTNITQLPADWTNTDDERRRPEVYNIKLFSMTADDAAGRILSAVKAGWGRLRLGRTIRLDRMIRLRPETYPRLIATWDRKMVG